MVSRVEIGGVSPTQFKAIRRMRIAGATPWLKFKLKVILILILHCCLLDAIMH